MISGTRRTKISIGHFESSREFKKRGKREERARNYYLGIKGRGVVRRQAGMEEERLRIPVSQGATKGFSELLKLIRPQ